jgi:sugar lactone lactonase YvrE
VVVEYPAGGGSAIGVAGGLTAPTAVAVDAAGDLFVVDAGTGSLVEVPAITGGPTTLLAGLSNPSAVAVDAAGNVYIADTGHNQVVKFVSLGATQTVVGTGLSSPQGVAVDAAGNIYISDTGNSRLVEVPAGGGSQVTLAGGLSAPSNVTAFGPGKLYLADAAHSRVLRVQTNAANLGAVNLCAAGQTTPAPCVQTATLNYSVTAAGALGTISALTLGAPNLDFTLAPGSTCQGSVTAGTSCTVNVQFVPKFAGTRSGAVQITNSSGAVVGSTPVYGAGNGPQAAFTSTQQTTLSGSFAEASALAVDGAGNLYVSDYSQGVVEKIARTGNSYGAPVNILSVSSPKAMAIDGTGNLYVVTYGEVLKFPVVGSGFGSAISIGVGLISPLAVAVDPAGNVFIADEGFSTVVKVPWTGNGYGAQTTVGANVNGPIGVAVDSAGNVFIAVPNRIVEVPASGGAQITVASGFYATPLSVDAAGDIYLINEGINGAVELPAGGGAPVVVASGSYTHRSLALDSGGDIFICDASNPNIIEIPRSQPPALSFANTVANTTSPDSPQVVTVENIGNAPLDFSAVTYPADFPEAGSGKSTDCTANSSLTSGADCSLTIDFHPVAPLGTKMSLLLQESVGITTNNGNVAKNAQQVAVSGTETLPVPTVTLSASTVTATVGSPVTLTVAASGTKGVPAGTITFYNGAVSLGAVTLTSTGSATLTTTKLPPGSDSVTAVYSGSTVYYLATSNAVVVNVAKVTPTIALTTTASLTILNTAVTFTAKLANPVAGYTQTGTINFYYDGQLLGSPTIAAGAASFTTNAIPVGMHSLTATYSGDTNYASVTSTAATLAVGRVAPGVILTVTPNPATVNGSITIKATVTGTLAAYPPAGNIVFFADGFQVASVAISASAASFALTLPTAGSYQLEAIYSGDSNCLIATSNLIQETVK